MKIWLAVAFLMMVVPTLQAALKTEEIIYEHKGTRFKGYIAFDDSVPGQRPGILVVHDWLGHGEFSRKKAEMLAGLGYVGFALDMYGDGQVGKTGQDGMRLSTPLKKDRNAMRERAQAALDNLKKHPKVDSKKIGCMGYCFGGTTALELARSGADVAGVVSFHGALATPMPAQQGKVKAKVLACHGAADPSVPPQEVAAFEKEMTDAGVDWQLIAYGNCVHSFTNPAANNRAQGVEYNADADRRSWEAMKAFWAELFR